MKVELVGEPGKIHLRMLPESEADQRTLDVIASQKMAPQKYTFSGAARMGAKGPVTCVSLTTEVGDLRIPNDFPQGNRPVLTPSVMQALFKG